MPSLGRGILIDLWIENFDVVFLFFDFQAKLDEKMVNEMKLISCVRQA